MFFSENIYFLILFTLPAALNVIYNAHIRHVPVAKPDKSVYFGGIEPSARGFRATITDE